MAIYYHKWNKMSIIILRHNSQENGIYRVKLTEKDKIRVKTTQRCVKNITKK